MKRPHRQRQLPLLHDVLVPQGLIRRNEIAHLANRLRVGGVDHLDATAAQEGFVTAERDCLVDDQTQAFDLRDRVALLALWL
ncbi:MAG: hypothetical protein ACOYMK_14990 [Hyphomonadaceae bacterium]|jgi:hypothetical protein